MELEKYLRISRFLGEDTINKLKEKKIVIVGLGAVGGFATESLARSAIGHFRLVDFDTVSITNINRQIFALDSTIGKLKTEVAKQRLYDIDPTIEVETLPIFAHEDTLDQILDGKPDLVIDAIDSLNPKCALLLGTQKRGIPVISSMGAALRKDPTLIQEADLFDTWGCPLAKQVRTNLRKRGAHRGIKTIFSPEKVVYEYKKPEEEKHADFNEQIIDRGRRRNVLGSLPTVTGIFGLRLAHLALNILLENTLTGDQEWNPNA